MLRCDALQAHYVPVPVPDPYSYDVAIWLRRAALPPDAPPPVPQVVDVPTRMGRRCLFTDVTTRSGRRLRLGTVHLESQSNSADTRQRQLELILPALKTSPWAPTSRALLAAKQAELERLKQEKAFLDGDTAKAPAEEAEAPVAAALPLPEIAVLTGDLNLCSRWEAENRIVAQDPDVTDLWPELEAGPGWTEDTKINEMRYFVKEQHKQVRFDRVLLIRPGGAVEGGVAPEPEPEPSAAGGEAGWRGERIALLGTSALPFTTADPELPDAAPAPAAECGLQLTLDDDGGRELRVWPSDRFGLVAILRPGRVALVEQEGQPDEVVRHQQVLVEALHRPHNLRAARRARAAGQRLVASQADACTR